ncbi:hypothetical protein SI65_08461 [Aspergillus cristatus]|uniref:Uncharacterized protein n=1 Tax=Aspergillus cristatus TaxID=573508 RepID=A0A1E3B506_ASPCR|nr:hypothetical protein SI65_08461 [Aspergillus cristatus]
MQILLDYSQNWTVSLHTFTTELLESGVVEKGPKGELLSRLIFTLAHDALMPRLDYKMRDAGLLTFTVRDFLKALYTTHHPSSLGRNEWNHTRCEREFHRFCFYRNASGS